MSDGNVTRMRLVGWQVCPVVMADNGEDIENRPVQPMLIPAKDWESWKAGGDKNALEQVRHQIETSKADGQGSSVA